MKTTGMPYTVIFTFCAAFLFVLALSLAHSMTSETVARNEALAKRKAVLSATGIPFKDDEEAMSLYSTHVTEFPENENLYQVADTEGEELYALRFSGPGLWGTITGIMSVSADSGAIRGIEIISHNETPGLGGKIDSPAFKEQFQGEKPDKEGKIKVGTGGPGDTDHGNSRVDGISGATRTSELFEKLINTSLEKLAAIREGAK